MPLRPPVLAPCEPACYPRHRPISAAESKALDRAAQEVYGVPSLALMEHASHGTARLAQRLHEAARAVGRRGRVLVVCGPGSNGGDGFGAARFLLSWGLEVQVLVAGRALPDQGDAGREAAWVAREVEVGLLGRDLRLLGEALTAADVVVDALFGVGLSRPLDAPWTTWIEALNAADVLRLAVDVPSGLRADTGAPSPVAVEAHVTATMGAPKHGLLEPSEGARWAGQVVEVDIGLPGPLHRPYLLARSGPGQSQRHPPRARQ